MKNYKWLIVPAMALAFASCEVQGHVVESRPADVYDDRPVSPGPDYVWISGDWYWEGGAYAWHRGHWTRPRTGRSWMDGRWEQHGRGWRWHRGGWH